MAEKMIVVKVIFNKLPAMPAASKRAVSQAVLATAIDVETGAKERCPVDTGNLRASITHQMTGETSALVGTGPQAPYAVYVHNGARGRAARPFLVQALEAVRGKYQERLHAILGGLS